MSTAAGRPTLDLNFSNNPDTRAQSAAQVGAAADTSRATLYARVDAALERVRPSILVDGGDVWLISIDDDIAFVQLVGACGGCAAAVSTLKLGIERVVREDVPEIRAVEQV